MALMATLSPHKAKPPHLSGAGYQPARQSRRAGEGRAINLCPARAAGELTQQPSEEIQFNLK